MPGGVFREAMRRKDMLKVGAYLWMRAALVLTRAQGAVQVIGSDKRKRLKWAMVMQRRTVVGSLCRAKGAIQIAACLGWLFVSACAHAGERGSLPIAERVEMGEVIKIACFGDSITGVYYHSGGRRAWPDLVNVGLRRIYPGSLVQIVNAGVSADTTTHALKRLESDVLSHHPQLVVVMFGMNDVVVNSPETYRNNLRQIVKRAQINRAEVILMTPNVITADDPLRPPWRLAEYAGIVRQVGREMQVPVADVHHAFDAIRAVDRRAWLRLMSDPIHPNMRGHKVLAEEVVWTISGSRTSLAELPALEPGWPRVVERLKAKQIVRIESMKPFDRLVPLALQSLLPGTPFRVVGRDVNRKSLPEIEQQAKDAGWWSLRNRPDSELPDLVVVAVPPSALAATAEQFYRQYSAILNWSIGRGRPPGKPAWDCIVLLPSVAQPGLDQAQQTAEQLALEVVLGQDIPWLQRAPGDTTPTVDLLAQKMQSLLGLIGSSRPVGK